MIPAPYNTWPVVMSQNKAAKLLGVDQKHWQKTSSF